MRTAEITRKTTETDISIKLNIDGAGVGMIDTGCGFFDHMLTLFKSHSRMDLDISCKGDAHIDYHHSVEDVGIALGQALLNALGDKRGIKRYGNFTVPMDETLVQISLDFSGRSTLCENIDIKAEKVGDFDTELCKEFLCAFTRSSELTLHVIQHRGENAHHIIEAVFKALARAIREAVSIDSAFANEIPSTKGVL